MRLLGQTRNYDYLPFDPKKIKSTEKEPLPKKVKGEGLINCDATKH
jgi:hypothetical protein